MAAAAHGRGHRTWDWKWATKAHANSDLWRARRTVTAFSVKFTESPSQVPSETDSAGTLPVVLRRVDAGVLPLAFGGGPEPGPCPE